MLIISCILSISLVAGVYLAYAKQGSAVFWAFLACCGATASILTCFLPAFWLHCMAVLPGTLLWRSRQW